MISWLKETADKLTAEINSIPEPLQPSHFPGLDGLRGVAILCVIFSHALLDKGVNYFCYGLGMVGVQTFFVISGFLITSLLLKEKVEKGKVSLKKFYLRRFLRLAPVAYLFLLVAGTLALVFNLDLSIGSFLSAAFYIKNLPIVQGNDRLVGHFWTLSIEEQFYFIFPFFLVYRTNKYLLGIGVLVVLIPLFSYLGYNKVGVFYSNRFIHVVTFTIINLFGNGTLAILVGSIFSVATFRRIITVERVKNPYFLSFLIFLAAAVLRMVTVYNFYNVDFGMIVFSIIVAYVILLNLKGENLFSIFLSHPILEKIGLLSYSLYIWQALFTHDFIWKGWFQYSDSIWINIPILFLVAYLSYHYYERRFLKIKSQLH